MKKKITKLSAIVLALLMVVITMSPLQIYAYTWYSDDYYEGTCGKLEDVHVPQDNVMYKYSCGTLYITGNGEMWGLYGMGGTDTSFNPFFKSGINTIATEIAVSEGVTTINCFNKFNNLTNVSLPDSLNKIGTFCFEGCTSLKRIDLPYDTVVRQGAFMNCTALEDFAIRSGQNNLEAETFKSCSSLKYITLPDTITEIGTDCFAECSSLTDVYYEGSEAQWGLIDIYPGNQILENVNIHYDSLIDPLTGRVAFLTDLSLVVYENTANSQNEKNNYILSSGAHVATDTKSVVTQDDGNAVIYGWSGEEVYVSKVGYVTRIFNRKTLLKSKNIYLQKESDYPVICSLWMNNVDILNESYHIDPESPIDYQLTTDIYWGSSNESSVKLVQNNLSKTITDGTIKLDICSYFNVSEPIYIVATNKEGLTTKKQLKIELLSAIPDSLNNAEIKFGDKISFTLPDACGELFSGTELALGLYDHSPFEITVEDGKWYVAIGVQIDSELDTKDGEWKSKEVKSFCDQIKDAYKNGKKEWKDMKDFRSSLKGAGKFLSRQSWDIGVEVDGSLCGYLEGYLDAAGDPVLTGGGFIVVGGASGDFTLPFYFLTLPFFFNVKIAGEIRAKMDMIHRITPSALSEFTPHGELHGDVTLTGKVGIGVKKAASFGGGLKGKWMNTLEFYSDPSFYYQMRATLNAFVFAEVLNFSGEKEFDSFYDDVWKEYPDNSKSASLPSIDTKFIYDENFYKPVDIDSVKAVTNEAKVADGVFSENSYSNSRPQIVSFSDGTRLAVWVGRDPSRTGYDGLCLYSSYYNGTDWETPAIVDNDGYMDGNPTLTLINDTAYLLWLNASTSVNNITELEDLAEKIDISLGVFNKDSKRFSNTRITNNNSRLDLQPVIVGDSNTQYVVWLTNNENDWFGYNDANEIHSRTCIDGIWGEETILYSGLNMIESMDANYSDDSLNVAYSIDTDGSADTNDDLEIFVDGNAYTENDACDSGVKYMWNNLYFVQNGDLMRNGSSFINSLGTDSYTFVEGVDYSYLLYTLNDGLASSLYGVLYDEQFGYWGCPVLLMESDKGILSFSAALDGDNLLILANEAEISDDEMSYGSSEIVLHEIVPVYDFSVENVTYDPYDNYIGNNMSFSARIKNKGSQSITLLKAVFENSNGETVKELPIAGYVFDDTSSRFALPGEEAIVSFKCPITDELLADDLTVYILPVEGEDSYPEDNAFTLDLHYQNVGLDNMRYGITSANDICIFTDVVNYSYEASESFDVVLHKTTADGEELDRVTVSSIDAFELEHISFQIPSNSEGAFYITLEGLEDDTVIYDNSGFVAIDPSVHVTNVSLDETNIELSAGYTYQLTATVTPEDATNPDVIWESSNSSIATVDENGLVTALAPGNTTITVTTVDRGLKATCAVYVNDIIPVTDIVIEESDEDFLGVVMGGVLQLHAHVIPENATNQKIIWESWDEDMATVDENGLVTAGNKPGVAWIEAQSEEYYKYDYRRIHILFRDVTDPSLFYFDDVYDLANDGIVTGYKDGTFRPLNDCNRAAVVTFLWRSEGCPEPNEMAKFSDMTGNTEFDKAISWAVEQGITNGWNDNTFRPWRTCNRAAVVTFLWRLAGSPEPTNMATFSDMTDNEIFDKAISWAVENDITTGWNDNTFRPWRTCNRLAIVSFIARYMRQYHY